MDSNMKTYHYKVILLLMERPRTQTELCSELGMQKQNLNKICKDLISIGYLLHGDTIGRNIYLKINPNPDIQLIGQLSLKNV